MVRQRYQLISSKDMVIKESWNLFGLITCSLRKKLRYPSTFSIDIADQRILQFGWTKGTHANTQPKLVASDATLP